MLRKLFLLPVDCEWGGQASSVFTAGPDKI